MSEETKPTKGYSAEETYRAFRSAKKYAEELHDEPNLGLLGPPEYMALKDRHLSLISTEEVSAELIRDCFSAGFIFADPFTLEFLQDVRLCAEADDIPVFITGETGTGKEVVARCIHRVGSRNEDEFVSINCAGLPPNLLESELFGHVKGAFTDATQDKEGLVRQADGGTLFLDEIGDTPLDIQARLLRFLNDRKFVKVGGEEEEEVDVRFICATNQDISELVQRKRFRADLLHRVRGFDLRTLSLYLRPGDLPLLLYYFINQYNSRNSSNHSISSVSNLVIRQLLLYMWPGNVRELERVTMRACSQAKYQKNYPQCWLVDLRLPQEGLPLPSLLPDDFSDESDHLFYPGITGEGEDQKPHGVVALEKIPRLSIRNLMKRMDKHCRSENQKRWKFAHRLAMLSMEDGDDHIAVEGAAWEQRRGAVQEGEPRGMENLTEQQVIEGFCRLEIRHKDFRDKCVRSLLDQGKSKSEIHRTIGVSQETIRKAEDKKKQ